MLTMFPQLDWEKNNAAWNDFLFCFLPTVRVGYKFYLSIQLLDKKLDFFLSKVFQEFRLDCVRMNWNLSWEKKINGNFFLSRTVPLQIGNRRDVHRMISKKGIFRSWWGPKGFFTTVTGGLEQKMDIIHGRPPKSVSKSPFKSDKLLQNRKIRYNNKIIFFSASSMKITRKRDKMFNMELFRHIWSF